ncbi:hypothetical protein P280DRAFT_491031 [Massarina eburnea CBS 473.64]|uniref:Uncharacterized protein n=1 Tax=Massarina eburnea CBS 473.64 TaxID=1395130 RepID=A0A6A6RU23_9PLEO|nr:hypothetical protein P280DRAFT_491031 [Massarina eburnea CBS 473.64]
MEYQPTPAQPASTTSTTSTAQPLQHDHYHYHYHPHPHHHHHTQHSNVHSEPDDLPYAPRIERGSKGSSRSRAHDSVISHPLSPRPTSSVHHSIPPPDITSYPPRAHLAHLAHADPEKAGVEGSPRNSPPNSQRSRSVSAFGPESESGPAPAPDVTGEYREKGPEDRPVQLLLFLSLPCALLSLFIALWTLFALLISALLQPVRLFTPRSITTTSDKPTQTTPTLTSLLAPPLNFQLHLIYSYATSTTYSAPMLVVIHLFAPFVAAGVAVAAWTAACFWFFSAILGDPAGQDARNDGVESLLGVRGWWERWLCRALR